MINRGILYYVMIPLLLGVSLFQSSAASRLAVSGVKPDLVLLLVLVGTLIYGSRIGVVWAFVGGLGMDIFSGGPMGASSVALMLAAIVSGLGHRTLSRYNLFVPIGAAVAGTLVYAGTYLLILSVLGYLSVIRHSIPFVATVQSVVLPALVYNTTIMLLVMPFLNRVPESQGL